MKRQVDANISLQPAAPCLSAGSEEGKNTWGDTSLFGSEVGRKDQTLQRGIELEFVMVGFTYDCVCIHSHINARTTEVLAENIDKTAVNRGGQCSAMHSSVYTHLFSFMIASSVNFSK